MTNPEKNMKENEYLHSTRHVFDGSVKYCGRNICISDEDVIKLHQMHPIGSENSHSHSYLVLCSFIDQKSVMISFNFIFSLASFMYFSYT